jgi:ParB/RepB/Spo0J family partition protein
MNIAEARLQIRYRRIDEVKPDPRSPRRHTRKQIKQLARSIKELGFRIPILIDHEDNVISGHARILACKELGWSELPTIPVEDLSEAKRRALMLADNRLAENATWDERLLAEQLKDLSLADLDFSIEVTGFEMGEI